MISWSCSEEDLLLSADLSSEASLQRHHLLQAESVRSHDERRQVTTRSPARLHVSRARE